MNEETNYNSENWKVFALFLKDAAKEKGISNNKISKMSGMAPSTISRFFDLKFCLSFDKILKISEALGLTFKLEEK